MAAPKLENIDTNQTRIKCETFQKLKNLPKPLKKSAKFSNFPTRKSPNDLKMKFFEI